MTIQEEKKESKKNNWFRGFVVTLLTAMATTIGVAVIKYLPVMKDAIDNRTLKTVEDRVAVEKIIKIFDDTNGFEELMDHIHDPGVHMPKEAKDSSYVRRDEFEEFMSNMAIDNYNQKRSMDKILNEVHYQGKLMSVIFDKVDKLDKNN